MANANPMMTSELSDYAKFKGINFTQWQYRVMLKLQKKKLESIARGTETKPAEVIKT